MLEFFFNLKFFVKVGNLKLLFFEIFFFDFSGEFFLPFQICPIMSDRLDQTRGQVISMGKKSYDVLASLKGKSLQSYKMLPQMFDGRI